MVKFYFQNVYIFMFFIFFIQMSCICLGNSKVFQNYVFYYYIIIVIVTRYIILIIDIIYFFGPSKNTHTNPAHPPVFSVYAGVQ